jgi:uncharacterized protein DUF2802
MWRDALMVALCVMQMVALALLWRQARRVPRAAITRESDESGVPALMMVNALNKIDHRLSTLEVRSKSMDTPQRSVEVPAVQMTALRSASHHSSASNYELAQQLARDGSDLEQLMTCCGLSRNEAELVLRLYAKRA